MAQPTTEQWLTRQRNTGSHPAQYAATATLLLPVLPSSPAAADAALVDAQPKNGSSFPTTERSTVTFTFNEDVLANSAFVVVRGPTQKSVTKGEATVKDSAVSRKIDTTEPGTYTASYRVVSTDSHPVTGTTTFTVKSTISPSATPTTKNPDPKIADTTAEAGALDNGRENLAWIVLAIAVTGVLIYGSLKRARPDSE